MLAGRTVTLPEPLRRVTTRTAAPDCNAHPCLIAWRLPTTLGKFDLRRMRDVADFLHSDNRRCLCDEARRSRSREHVTGQQSKRQLQPDIRQRKCQRHQPIDHKLLVRQHTSLPDREPDSPASRSERQRINSCARIRSDRGKANHVSAS